MFRTRCIGTLSSLAFFLSPAFAASPAIPGGCGTHIERTREELYLHRRSQATGAARARAKSSLASAALSTNRDIGAIAVIDDTDVVARRNEFNLNLKTVQFTPTSSDAQRYRVTTVGDTYDAALPDIGQKLQLDDDDSTLVSLPFAFPFFGSVYRSVYVNSDGNLTFGGSFELTERSLGILVGGRPRIAGLFSDLDPTEARGSGGVYVTAEPWRFVVTFRSVPRYSDFGFGVPQTFQIRMYADGSIELAYSSVSTTIDAAVGISPGGNKGTLALIPIASGNTGEFSGPVADRFSGSDAVDIAAAAQRFYQTHEDAYDYLAFFNAVGVTAGDGVVAYEVTVRNNRTGYGDAVVDAGADFGSKRRLQAVLNMGPLYQYPENPTSIVTARGNTGDTGVTVLAHEVGHLFLAFTSVRDPDDPNALPMLGRASVHWAFNFNSEASVMEGNRIRDNGEGAFPRFTTTATVQGYAPLDQYLMGLRAPDEVPPTFVVTPASVQASRPPQTGVSFNGQRLNVTVDDIIAIEGRRTPDHSVSQRRYRFGFVLIGAAGTEIPAETVAKVERYRAAFEQFFSTATSDRATADASIKHAVQLSAAPAAGVVLNGTGSASIALDAPAAAPVTFLLSSSNGSVQTPPSVVIAAGETRASFPIKGVRAGVDQITVAPSDSSYEVAVAKVQVLGSVEDLTVTGRADGQGIAAEVRDINRLPYSGVRVIDRTTGAAAVTDESGIARFNLTSVAVAVEGSGAAPVLLKAPARPSISAGGVVNAASFAPVLTPGSLATVFGTALSGGTSASAEAPYPWAIGGVQVLLNGVAAPLLYVSDGQVNFQVPANLTGDSATIAVVTPNGVSNPVQVPVRTASPGVFVIDGAGQGAVLIAGTGQTTFARPARQGDYLEIYCTGLAAGVGTPEVTIGGVGANVLAWTQLQQYPGLCQINVAVPQGAGSGNRTLLVRVNGVASNETLVRLQ